MRGIGWALLMVCLLSGAAAARAATPSVVVTIKPIHALAASVMEAVAEPKLLITGSASPHSYALKPSDARMLQNADLIIRVGPGLEATLNTALDALPHKASVLVLEEAEGVKRLPARAGGSWEEHRHAAEGHDDRDTAHEHDEHQGAKDPHIWLDPENAKAIVTAMAKSLTALDPAHAAQYAANAEKTMARIDRLAAEIKTKTARVRDLPFLVFHDAYQYFERRYGLNAVGSVTISPDRQPGAKRVHELRRKIEAAGAACLFAEPQFEPKLMRTLAEGTAAGLGVLDPEGTGLEPGPDQYFVLMRGLATNLTACLEPKLASPPR